MINNFYNEWVNGERNFLKKFIKKIYYKLFSVIFRKYDEIKDEINGKYEDGLNRYNELYISNDQLNVQISNVYNELKDEIEAQDEKSVSLNKQYEIMSKNYDSEQVKQLSFNKDILSLLDHKVEKQDFYSFEDDFKVVIKEVIKSKWKFIDFIAKQNEKDEDLVKCIICNYESTRGSYGVKTTECIFNGGQLERYVCPSCGAIFGPTKFYNLSQEEKNEDYRIHYLVFDEVDYTNKEERAFFMLEPDKKKTYLNYGCGKWSSTIQKLRNMGYQIYGYEPYALKDEKNPYLITDKEIISRMKFDGIFTNDVIEHLINPIEDFLFMKSLLKLPDSKMSHSTSCYIYKHEFTRFHTCFFTGESNKVLCERSGLEILNFIDDEKENDFICCVYKPIEKEMNYIQSMVYLKDNTILKNDKIILKDNVLFGPYISLNKGKYILKLTVENEKLPENKFYCNVTSGKGERILDIYTLNSGLNLFELNLEQIEKDIEFIIKNETDYSIYINSIVLGFN